MKTDHSSTQQRKQNWQLGMLFVSQQRIVKHYIITCVYAWVLKDPVQLLECLVTPEQLGLALCRVIQASANSTYR